MHGLVRYVFVVAALAACHGTDTATPDGGPGDAAADTGLAVHWTTKQAIPGDVSGNVQVASATLRFDSLALISDTGGGDPRTIWVNFQEAWGHGGTTQDISFPAAPPGLYSKVTFEIDGLLINDSIDIDGTVRISGSSEPFELHDVALTDVSLDCSAMLQPGGMSSIGLEIDFGNALNAIDFDQVPTVGGMHVVLPTDPQMDGFRTRLQESVRVIGAQARSSAE